MKWGNLKLKGTMLFLMVLSLSCASSQILSAPPLEQRTLRISRDGPWLEYQYWKCTKRMGPLCWNREKIVEKWDLTNSMTREDLIDMGFVVKVREKIY